MVLLKGKIYCNAQTVSLEPTWFNTKHHLLGPQDKSYIYSQFQRSEPSKWQLPVRIKTGILILVVTNGTGLSQADNKIIKSGHITLPNIA